jgi:hypothetical protein
MIKPIFFSDHKHSFYLNLLIWALIISLIVLVGSLAFPKYYKAYNTYYIDAQYPNSTESVIDFSPQQLAEKTADNIKGIIESPNFLGRVLENAGYENTNKSREKLGKKIMVKKVGPQVLYVEISGYRDSQALEKTINSLTQVLTTEVSAINSNGNTFVAFNEVNENPNVEQVQIYPFLNAGLAFLIVIVLGISLFEFKKYIEK